MSKTAQNGTQFKELQAIHDSRKSFYGKAHVRTDDNGTDWLVSYETTVACISSGGTVLFGKDWDSSATTLRHVKEFLLQHGLPSGTKADLKHWYVDSISKRHYEQGFLRPDMDGWEGDI